MLQLQDDKSCNLALIKEIPIFVNDNVLSAILCLTDWLTKIIHHNITIYDIERFHFQLANYCLMS